MSREVHVPFYERLGVQFPPAYSPIRSELPGCRGLAGPAEHHGHLRDHPPMGPDVRSELRSRSPAPRGRLGDIGHLDEDVTLQGQRLSLWRAVDQEGDVLDILVQSRRDCRAATRLFRTLLKGQARQPVRLGTDTLPSDRAAHRALMPSVAQRTDRYEHHRADVSHQPTRHRARHLRRFNSPGQAQRFLSVHGLVRTLFRGGRHLVRAVHHRELRRRSFLIGDAVTLAA